MLHKQREMASGVWQEKSHDVVSSFPGDADKGDTFYFLELAKAVGQIAQSPAGGEKPNSSLIKTK